MFTGLVECTGNVLRKKAVAHGARYTLDIPFGKELSPGDSVAVNGCCLTVDAVRDGGVEFDLLAQTMRVTSLGRLEEGDLCNLERAMSGADRFGGHFVMGHVDTTGEVASVSLEGQDHVVHVRIPEAYMRYTIDKGSIAVDGVSLTIARILSENMLEFWITPHTWLKTNMRSYAPGTAVNIEVEMLAKYVEKLLSVRTGEKSVPPPGI